MANANRTTVIDDAGSYFRYENKTVAQADCAKFNYMVENYHSRVEEALDSSIVTNYIVTVFYGRTGADYACTFGPNWKEDVKQEGTV